MSPFWFFLVPVGIWFISGLRVIQEYEAGVIFRLGRFAEVKRAGLNWIVPGLDRMVKVDLRTVTRDVPPQDVITYAAKLMNLEPPPEEAFETAEMSAMARSFYASSARVSNARLKRELGVTLAYPTYRHGLDALWHIGEGR